MSLFGEETITVDEDAYEDQSEETAVDTDSEEVTDEVTEETELTDEEETDSEPEQSDELLLAKFKSTDDLMKAYTELQKQFTQNRQQKPAAQPDADELYQSYDRDPVATINYLVQQGIQQALSPIHQERQIESLTKNLDPVAKEYKQLHSDEGVNQLFQKIGELSQDFGNPELVRNPTQRIIKMAAAELWGSETKGQVFQTAREQGRQEAESMRKQKLGLAVTTTKKPTEAPKTEADHIIDGMMAASGKRGLFG